MSFAPSPILSRRQRRFYRDRGHLLRPVQQFSDTSGVALGPSWVVVALNVPCHFEIRPTVDASAVFGRYSADNLLTLDVLHLGEFQECGPEYLVKNVTLDPDGTPSANYGEWAIIRGLDRSITRARFRGAGKRSFFLFRQTEPPRGSAEVLALALEA